MGVLMEISAPQIGKSRTDDMNRRIYLHLVLCDQIILIPRLYSIFSSCSAVFMPSLEPHSHCTTGDVAQCVARRVPMQQ